MRMLDSTLSWNPGDLQAWCAFVTSSSSKSEFYWSKAAGSWRPIWNTVATVGVRGFWESGSTELHLPFSGRYCCGGTHAIILFCSLPDHACVPVAALGPHTAAGTWICRTEKMAAARAPSPTGQRRGRRQPWRRVRPAAASRFGRS